MKLTVSVDTKRPLNARSVMFRCRGFRNRTVSFLNKYGIAWICKDGKNELPVGRLEQKFQFELGKDCPPTYKDGKIIYKVRLEIDQPWSRPLFIEKEFKMVHKLADQKMSQVMTYTSSPRFDALFSNGQPTFKVTMPKFTLYPGETTEFKLEVENHSSSTVKKIYAELEAEPFPLYHIYGNTKAKGKMHVLVAPYSTQKFTIPFTIPTDLTASFHTCGSSLKYTMKFGLVTDSWLTTDPALALVVSIGELESEEKKDEALKTPPPPPYTA